MLLLVMKSTEVQTLGALCLFSRHLSNAVVSGKSPVYFSGCVVLKLLVSLTGRLVACSARIRVVTHTDKATTVTLAAHVHRGLIMKGMVHVCNPLHMFIHFVKSVHD